jgi:hypothetical protein
MKKEMNTFSSEDLDFTLPAGQIDIPDPTPVDDMKIAQDMTDWRKAKSIMTTLVADPSRTLNICPNVLVEPPTEEGVQILKEHLEKKEKMIRRIMSTIKGWCIKNNKEFPQDYYQK